jgi:uncharacterized protein DUF3443
LKRFTEARTPKYVISVSLTLALFAGCGGGGGGSPSSSSANLAAPAPVTNQAANPSRNVLPISVGPANKVNLPFASVTVCAPGSSAACQTIDRVLIDTGSSGLRIAASALTSVSLPPQTDAGGNSIAECAQFADGYTWGPVKIADVRIAGEHADALPIQVIGDAVFLSVPAGCSSTGRSKNTVQTLGANGILGISAFRHDCGNACVQSSSLGIYYACTPSGCLPTARSLAEQLTNPVSMFADDNNGVIVELPAVPAEGSASVDGSLVFGIGTQKNNALGDASVFALSPLTGGVITFFNGEIFDHSYIDTGSNALFFRDASIPACGSGAGNGFYCAGSPQNLSATIQGMNGTNANVTFSVANADSLVANGSAAFSNLAAPVWSSSTFDWGLPFFFGRRVFVAIEGANVAGASAGPFIAF